MKRASMLIYLALILPSLGFAAIVIEQNFQSPVFPPSGWSIETVGTGGSWIWTDAGQPGNGFAHGMIVLETPSQQGSASLITNNFAGVMGRELNIQFMRRTHLTGYEPSDYSWAVHLRTDNTVIASHIMQVSPGYPDWYNDTWVLLQLPFTSPEYNIVFEVSGEYGSGFCKVLFDLDGLIITMGALGAEPTSLGSIKAAFLQ